MMERDLRSEIAGVVSDLRVSLRLSIDHSGNAQLMLHDHPVGVQIPYEVIREIYACDIRTVFEDLIALGAYSILLTNSGNSDAPAARDIVRLRKRIGSTFVPAETMVGQLFGLGKAKH